MNRVFIGLTLALSLLVAGCGGGGGGTGGGGGGSTTVNLLGRVLWIETGGAPEPRASVQAGTNSVTTDPVDGSFTVAAPSGTDRVTVTYQPATSSAPVIATFTFTPATSTTDLGDLYIGPSTVRLEGRLLDSTSSTPVSGADLSIAGRTASSGSDGRFAIDGVAFSDQALAVFLGLTGSITAPGYFSRDFSPPSGPTAGVVSLGDLTLVPAGTSSPPGLPYNVQGFVLPVSNGAGASVTISGGGVMRETVADSSGQFQFWVPAGTYTLQAEKAALNGSAIVTVTDVDRIVSQNVDIN